MKFSELYAKTYPKGCSFPTIHLAHLVQQIRTHHNA